MVKCVTHFQDEAFSEKQSGFATKRNKLQSTVLENSKIRNKTQQFQNPFSDKQQKVQQNTTFSTGSICYMRNPIPSLAEKYSGKAVKFAVLVARKADGTVGFCSLWLL